MPQEAKTCSLIRIKIGHSWGAFGFSSFYPSSISPECTMVKGSRPMRQLILASLVTAWLSAVVGCSTPAVYREPIGRFQSAVNNTIATIQPYFLEVNKVETEYQLYSAIKMNKDWGTQHLNAGLGPHQIALRVAALQLIADHARLLADIVDSSAPDDVKKAAEALGANAQRLADTIAEFKDAKKEVPDFGTPLAQIVGLLGKMAIEKKQIEAIETAVLAAEKPLSGLLDKLEQDLRTVIKLRKKALAGITTVRLDIFNEIRKNTKPEKIDSVIQQVLDLRTRAETVASVDVTALLRDLKSTHQALVRFVRSDKTPADLSSFVASVNVFADNAAAVSNIIQSLRQL